MIIKELTRETRFNEVKFNKRYKTDLGKKKILGLHLFNKGMGFYVIMKG